MTVHGARHPKADIQKLYMKRVDGGRGKISVRECSNSERRSMAKYLVKSKDLLQCADNAEDVHKKELESVPEFEAKTVSAREETLLCMEIIWSVLPCNQEIKGPRKHHRGGSTRVTHNRMLKA